MDIFGTKSKHSKEERGEYRFYVRLFVMNNRDELLLVKTPELRDQYACIEGSLQQDEAIIEAVQREALEKTGLQLTDIELLDLADEFDLGKSDAADRDHPIFIGYTARALNEEDIKPGDELSAYEWLPLEHWLKKNQKEFAPNIYGELEKIKEKEMTQNYVYLYKRALADYQNLRKQTEAEKQEFVKYANENLLSEILPAYSHLNTALVHAGNEKNGQNGLEEGLRHVVKQFEEVLSRFGVEMIRTKNEKFDHLTMEALDKKATSDKDMDGMVAEEMKPGFILNGKVIEPAKVAVWEYEKGNLES